MASRNFASNKIYNQHIMPVQLDIKIPIGASGAVGSISGLGINSVTRLAAGIYRLQLQDNYNASLRLDAGFRGPVVGSSVAGGAFVTGTAYQILTLGTTTQAQWVAAGLPSGVSAAVGEVFVAVGAGAGTGTVKAVGNSGIRKVEQIGDLQQNQPFVSPSGGYIMVQCLADTSAADPTMIPADPVSGSVLSLRLLLSNSSVQ